MLTSRTILLANRHEIIPTIRIGHAVPNTIENTLLPSSTECYENDFST